MKQFLYIGFIAILLGSCKQNRDQTLVETPETKSVISFDYATGLTVQNTETGIYVTVKKPWPDATKDYTYKLVPASSQKRELIPELDAGTIIQVPVKRIIATSTTHLPPLDLLGVEKSLVGFPETDYISNSTIRNLIESGNIQDVGINERLDVESVILTQPDVVIGYGVEGENPTYNNIQKAGIPVLFSGAWVEKHPLGRAEWIKLYGLLFGKQKQADSIFNKIKNDYLQAKELVVDLPKPTVIAGATWKDVWYLPYGDSWQGLILADAGCNYIYENTSGKGSLAYNIEQVLKDAQKADYWIAPGSYTTYSNMLADNQAYGQFKAFQQKKLYTFALKRGSTGGFIYYEEASMRPDLVLKDIIYLTHDRDLLKDYQPYFFSTLLP
ncbi:ABC transporter substrate-binding protein [Nonlabens sp. SY33080]|uniref:ABC transporter substrate-binding protein n=1 Tax=Nonlabens sp. SY33080 TaxID=2719911 RepID=UPI0014288A75|nr:ABC transporter substrate-binding protein [Nonlabens sp. SY33080]